MPFRPSERSLRRLVAELSTASAEDIRLVLGELEPGHRRRVSGMLEQLAAENDLAPPPGPRVAASAAVPRLDGLSPWLAGRLERSAGRAPALTPRSRQGPSFQSPSIDDAPFTLTATVTAALQACALELQPGYAGAAPEAAGPSLLGRLHELVLRRELAS